MDELTEADKKTIIRRFRKCLNLRTTQYLDARDVEPTFENIAIIAQRLEVAHKIPRIQAAEPKVNMFQVKPDGNSGKVSIPNSITKAGKPNKIYACYICQSKDHFLKDCPYNKFGQSSDTKFCTICRKTNHLDKDCRFNEKSPNYNKWPARPTNTNPTS